MDKKVEVINKFGQTLAIFTSEDEETVDRMIDPVVTLTQNSDNVFSFSISEKSQKWEDIKSVENLYVVDGHVYSPLFADSYNVVKSEDGQNLIQVRAYERQKMLEKVYVTAWNSETGFADIDAFMVVILSKGNLPLKNGNKATGVEAIVDPGEYSLGSAGYIMAGLLYGTGWNVGIVDVEGYFDFETEQLSVYENLLKVQELYGGILIFDSMNKIVHLRQESNYISYTGYEVRYKKNLKDMDLNIDNKIVTRLYVFGEAGLNIASVNDEKIYLENYTYSNEVFEGIESNTDIYEPDQLKAWGERKLLDLCAPRKVLTTNIAYLTQKEGFEQEKLKLNDSVRVYYDEAEFVAPEAGVEIVSTEIEAEGVKAKKESYITLKGNTSQATSILPDEYQQVEYITSNAKQYIKTGFAANQDTSIEMKVTTTTLSSNAAFYCSRRSLNNNTFCSFRINGQLRHDYGNTQADTSYTLKINTPYKIYSNKNKLYVDDSLVHTATYTNFQSPYKMLLLASQDASQDAGANYWSGNLYYCKIWDDETLVRDFVPCYRKSDNVIGLYDRVEGTFYTNAGTGNFTKGDDTAFDPSPDHPSEVKVVKGENNFEIVANNLINKSGNFAATTTEISELNTGIRVTIKNAGSYRYAHQKIGGSELLGKTLFLSANMQASSENKPHLALWYGNSTTSAVKSILALTANGTKSITLPDEFPDNCDRINFLAYGNANGTGNAGDYVDYTNLTLSINKPLENYEPYQKTSYTVNFGNLELCEGEYTFKNSIENPHYNPNLELNAWYKHKVMNKIIFDGSESWSRGGTSVAEQYRFAYSKSSTLDILIPETNDGYMLAYCNLFSISTANLTYRQHNGISCTRTGRLDIYYEPLKEYTANEFKAWLSTHNVTLQYTLATPIDEKITDLALTTQLEALYKATLVSPYSHIYSDSGFPIIDLRYNVITPSLYIESNSDLLRVTGVDYPVFNPSSATLTLGDVTLNTNDIFKKISNTTNAYTGGLIPAGSVKTTTYDGISKPITQEFETQHTLNSTFQYGIDSLNLSVSEVSKLVDENGDDIKTLEEHIGKVEVTAEGLKTTVTNRSGNNLLRNSSALFGEEFWRGEVVQSTATEVQQNFFAKSCFYLQDGTLGQNIAVPNGDYYVGFKYKKLVELANCVVSVNGSPITLDKMEYTIVDKYITVNDNNIDIEIKSDTDNSFYLGDIMVVAGNKEKWSPNPNEIFYDTVEIGKGIQVNSNTANSYTRIDADGNRIYNKASREVVTELTDEGMITNKVYCEQLTAAGVLHQEVLDKYNEEQAWLTKI